MSDQADREWGPETRALHSGQEEPDPATGARAPPIYQTTSCVFDDAEDAVQRLRDEVKQAAGVTEDMVRISVGLESIDDTVWDRDQAIDRVTN